MLLFTAVEEANKVVYTNMYIYMIILYVYYTCTYLYRTQSLGVRDMFVVQGMFLTPAWQASKLTPQVFLRFIISGGGIH